VKPQIDLYLGVRQVIFAQPMIDAGHRHVRFRVSGVDARGFVQFERRPPALSTKEYEQRRTASLRSREVYRGTNPE